MYIESNLKAGVVLGLPFRILVGAYLFSQFLSPMHWHLE